MFTSMILCSKSQLTVRTQLSQLGKLFQSNDSCSSFNILTTFTLNIYITANIVTYANNLSLYVYSLTFMHACIPVLHVILLNEDYKKALSQTTSNY